MSWRQKSFEVLPALRVRGQTLRQSLRTVTAAWMFGVVWMACISGSQVTLFGRLLGFGYWHFGILTAIPFAAAFAQLVAAVMIERSGLRKYQFIYFASIHRLLWIAIAGVGVLLKPGPSAAVIFLCTYATSCLLGHLSSPPWQTWMGDLIPRRIRGRYFANRTTWTIPIQVAVAAGSGLLLDCLTRPLPAGATMTTHNQPYLPWAIAGLFALGGIFGTIDILLFLGLREIVSPPLLQPHRRRRTLANVVLTLWGSFQVIGEAFKDRVFRHYALYGATIGFSMAVCNQFLWLNALENVGYSKLGANLTFLVFSAVSSFNVVRLWGRLIDRWGRRPILMLCTLGIVFGPAGWFLMPPGNMVIAYTLGIGSSVISGALWSGLALAQTNIVLGFSESAGRSRLIAACAVVAAVGGFAGGLAGGAIAEAFGFLQEHPLQVGPFLWTNYHVTFAVSSLMRAAAVLWLIGMPDPGSRPFRDVVRDLWFSGFSNVATRLFWPLRTVGRTGSRRHRSAVDP